MIIKFPISKRFIHKGYIFLLSVVGTNAFWSTHKYDGDLSITPQECNRLFYAEHEKQIEGLIAEAEAKEAEEFKDKNNILDLTNQEQ